MMATPERIELENCGWSSMTVEPEEVSEEILNQFNLSLDEKIYQKPSSESEMEGEEEERAEGDSQYRVTSGGAKNSWGKTLQLHLRDEDEGQGSSGVESGEEEEFPLTTQSVTSAAGSDITHYDTPVEPDSRSSPLQSSRPPPEAPTTRSMPFTDSFINEPDSTTDKDTSTAQPTHVSPVVMETDVQRHIPWQPAGGQCLFDDNPELPLKKHIVLQGRRAASVEEAGSEELRKRRPNGANSLPSSHPPSLQDGSGALLLLKGHREAPPTRQVQVEGGGARALWRTVFSGNGKETKKKRGRTSPAGAKGTNHRRATDVRGSLADETDLDSSALLQRCSLTPQNNPSYVPHALAFKRAYAIKRRSQKERVPIWDSDGQSSCPTEVVGVLFQPKEPSSLSVKETMFQMGQEDEDLDAKPPRRVQRAARRKTKQEQLKRLHKAQMIQRQLQQVEEKQRQLEERGVMVEKTLRGEADYWEDFNYGNHIELHLAGLSKPDNHILMQQWFQLVQQKNSLVRYESELIIFARELELEDRQSRLQQELRERMTVDDHLKEEWQLMEERLILEEMLEVVEQRGSLVSLLEEKRLHERQEDQDLDEVTVTQ